MQNLYSISLYYKQYPFLTKKFLLYTRHLGKSIILKIVRLSIETCIPGLFKLFIDRRTDNYFKKCEN